MKKNIGKICIVLITLLFLPFITQCIKPVNGNKGNGYSSYRYISGVTDDEIRAINTIKGRYSSFVFGTLSSTEAFTEGNGDIKGYAALFCNWLTELFDIPFEPKFYEWNELIDGLQSNEINFTGELTANEERRKTYFMTDTIAERSIKYMRISKSIPLFEITAIRPLRYVFLEGTTTVDLIRLHENLEFEAITVDDYDEAYVLLKSGKADAFFDEGTAEAAFDIYGDITASDFFPLIFSPVSLATQNPDLEPIITVVQKALQHGGIKHLTELYKSGLQDYKKHKLLIQLTEEEQNYISTHPWVSFAAEYDNYPACFYNTRDKQWQGISIDILHEVEELTGLHFKLVNDEYTDWPDLLTMLEDGRASMISELIPSDDREGRFLWPETSILTDYYALISRSDFRNIDTNEILYVSVGLTKDTAYAEVFNSWFPNHAYIREYDSTDAVFAALGRGEIDMVMASQNQLLVLTNYQELAGYRSNIVFDRSYESTYGFNKNEAILCSIVDKALHLIDIKGISGQWTRKTYDYRAKLSRVQLPWLIGASILMLCILVLLFVLFQKNRYEGKRLEDLIQIRTAELNKQHELMYVINGAAVLLLETDTNDYSGAMIKGMEMIARCIDVDRISIWQNHRNDDDKLYYRLVNQWATEDLPELESDKDFAYQEILPSWEYTFNKGETVNGPVSSLSEEERMQLQPFSIQSILAVPIFLKDEFWGFISFDDYHSQRYFHEGEANILRSWGLLIVGAIQRGKIAANMEHTLTKLETVIKNYKGIIWNVDEKGIITTFNGQYLEKIGLTSSFLEGKNIEIARKKSRHLDIIEYVEKTRLEGSQDWIGNIDGGVYHSHTTPMYDSDGGFIGVVGSTDDVTDTIKLQHDLETALEAAQAGSRAKSAFLANMSHEIRTPMNAIIGMINIGKSSTEMDRKDYCFTKIEDASKHLLGVINDILDMSKIEANKFELSATEFHFEKMLQRVVNVVNFRVDEKQQKLKVHIDRAVPRFLIGDDQRLAQVITNLLSNSVKFTPEKGTIRINVKFLKEENNICSIKFEVIDSGIGISEEQQGRLFQSFAQAEASTTRKFGGTGLGLSISKSIVEMMGGRIWVESELGKGATFAFVIQAKRGEDKKHSHVDRTVNWDNVSILAVDDDPDILSYFREILNGSGIPCETASSGEDALKLVEKNGIYNVYFVDWKLPGINGIELTSLLKAKDSSGNSSVIMVSAVDRNAIEKEAKEAGVDKFLSKPLFPSLIVDAINDCLGIDHDQVKEKQKDIAGIFAGHHILLVEDVEINREIVLALLEPTQLKIDCAENGVEAVLKFIETPQKYDMIFMDIQMPEMDGYEATRRIRSYETEHPLLYPGRSNGVPIIAMTANVFKEDIEKSIESGMSNHIGKPLDFEEVLEKLEFYLLAS